MHAAFLIPHDREGLTPVALAREQPVTQAVGDSAASVALFFQPGDHLGLSCVLTQAVQAHLSVG